ncbi:hypothetical protein BCL79_0614 [Stenotrophomonas rhizophila]|uniref:Uncharacterized protein n=1 Tax=Stenotrophomonas rhizophila TaxID=216778 RepID=A0A498CGA9_9GAMM|nr:hypothetical protein [Stenotrophomonas rhizophila]RLK56231.1 hypothetical protein BCL79_0614 [Stenotrophomonas rhizophila]
MADPYSAGQVLGSALFGNTRGTYNDELGRAYKVEQALQQARKSRSDAILANDLNDQRFQITPELMARYRAGDVDATNQLITAGIRGNDKLDFSTLGDIEGATYRRDAVNRATLGDWDGANASMLGVANGPQELAAVQGQNLIRNQFREGGGGISTTEQGRAGMAADAARAAASYASANSSNASAARTRQAAGIDAAQFGMQRTGQWNPGGKAAGGTLGDKTLPVGALKELLGIEDALGSTEVLNDIIQKNAERIKNGTLKVGPADTLGANLRTSLNMSTDADVARKEWQADLTKIVNESLRLNKGVQTEGDAQRAAEELMGASDQKTVASALQRLSGFNRRAVELQQRKQALINGNYGRQPTLGEPSVVAPVRAQGLPAQGGAPAAGTVRNGYRFRGGNPADRNSWEKI